MAVVHFCNGDKPFLPTISILRWKYGSIFGKASTMQGKTSLHIQNLRQSISEGILN